MVIGQKPVDKIDAKFNVDWQPFDVV